MLRYRTLHLTSLDYTPCRCGRTHVRISRLQGRSDDMLIIRGVNVFPQQIEGLLMESDGLTPNYQIIVGTSNNLDTLEVRVEVSDTLFADEIRELQMLENRLQKSIEESWVFRLRMRLHGTDNPYSLLKSRTAHL